MADDAEVLAPSPAPSGVVPATPEAGAASSFMTVTGENGMVLSDAQLGNMALRAKQQRTKAEQDKQLLQNRINRLIIEQEKASKRIAETRRRAAEIQNLKQRNAASQAARSDATTWVQSEQELQRELLQENRANRSKAIVSSRAAMYSLRKDEVQVLKQMRQENEAAVKQQRELELQRAVERRRTVREHQKAASQRKAAEQSIAMSRLKDSRESRRQELDLDASSHLTAYSSLAEEEQRLIESLQKWQKVQRRRSSSSTTSSARRARDELAPWSAPRLAPDVAADGAGGGDHAEPDIGS